MRYAKARRWLAASSLAIVAASGMGPVAATAEIRVTDDFGREVVLDRPARRILSLAPHNTENLFSAGAGRFVVGVVEFSDYPPEAESIPSVGSYVQFNLEAVVGLDPDLVVAWQGGSNAGAMEQLERLGMTIYFSEPRTFEDVADNIRDLAILAGTQRRMDPRVETVGAEIQAAEAAYRDRPVLDIFYQVWSEPLMTLNGEHFISRILEVCGARNLFADLDIIAPRVSVEAVIQANPDVIITGLVDGIRPDMSRWSKWPMVKAVAGENFLFVDSDVMHRHTLRMLEGIPGFCEDLDNFRQEPVQ